MHDVSQQSEKAMPTKPVDLRRRAVRASNGPAAKLAGRVPQPLRPLLHGERRGNRRQGREADRTHLGLQRSEAVIVPELAHEVLLPFGGDLVRGSIPGHDPQGSA